jgi:hypothetical protein
VACVAGAVLVRFVVRLVVAGVVLLEAVVIVSPPP